MRQRVLSAAILVSVVAVVFLLGNPWLAIGIAALAGMAAYEAASLLRAAGLAAEAWLAVVGAVVAVSAPLLLMPVTDPGYAWLVGVGPVAGFTVLAGVIALRQPDPLAAVRAWAGTLLAAAYPALLAFATALLLVGGRATANAVPFDALDPGRSWLLVLVLTVWTLDSAAYLVGRAYPRGRFFNHLSPSKTWSGALGGTLAAVVVCVLLVWLATGSVTLLAPLLGLVIAISAQAGDLAESMLKRAAGAKDSGTLIPGHGGFLDRLDSFFFAAPATLAFVVVSGLG